jgi:hypothetical protein
MRPKDAIAAAVSPSAPRRVRGPTALLGPSHDASDQQALTLLRSTMGRDAQILGDNFACAFVHNGIEANFLPFLEVHPSGSLDRFDVNIDIKSPVNRLDKAIAFLGVEPLHDACGSSPSFSAKPMETIAAAT